jgi:hypothetical protein
MYLGTLQPVSNKATWVETVEVRDDDNEPLDITSATIVVAVRNKKSKRVELTAETGNGVTLPGDTGVFQFTFSVDQMGGLCPETYDVGVTIEIDDVTTQLFIGTVAVLDGVVA